MQCVEDKLVNESNGCTVVEDGYHDLLVYKIEKKFDMANLTCPGSRPTRCALYSVSTPHCAPLRTCDYSPAPCSSGD